VRAISSRIDLATLTEDRAARIDHDNASLASAASYDPSGAYLFVALETARQVAVLDAAQRRAADAHRDRPRAAGTGGLGRQHALYVHNFMGRSVQAVDLTPLTQLGELAQQPLASVATWAPRSSPPTCCWASNSSTTPATRACRATPT
jgi:hypothetical protein